MKYDDVAKSIVASAIKTHLKVQIKEHCQKVAKKEAEAWLKKNRTGINTIIKAEVTRLMDSKREEVAKAAAAAVTIKSPVRRNRYY